MHAQVAIEVDGNEHYTYNRAEVGGIEQYRCAAWEGQLYNVFANLCAASRRLKYEAHLCRPTGRTVLRNKLLRARGWAVCDVPWFEWNALRTQSARQAYLKARIALELQNLMRHHAISPRKTRTRM